ncbi:MAG: 2-oxo acid dehydrogenase subunit E2, partial [Pirellulales bacterium]|nr:2-oxo acid dehydrogenase subunit E2 [Pirellulales bacterium]
PELGEGILEAEVVQWLIKPGDSVERGQNLVEVLTDKATVDLPSPFDGEVIELRAEPGAIVQVGSSLLAYHSPTANGDEGEGITTSEVANGSASRRLDAPVATRVSAAPSVRRRARELGIELEAVVGSGPGGRILMGDLTRAAAASEQAAPVDSATAAASTGTRQPMRGVRRKIAEQMVRAKNTIPHYSYIDECDMTRLVELRDQLKPVLTNRGVKLTYLAFVLKAVARALGEVPLVNSSYDEAAGEIIFHEARNVGVAVATERGLIVPVVKNVDTREFADVAHEIQRIKDAARSGKVSRDDLQDATFSVTSIGSIGGLVSTPIINHPEVGILGIGKVIRRPVYDDRGQLRPADLMYLSLSFDHRVVDGAVGAEFANAVIRQLENPATLLLPAVAT